MLFLGQMVSHGATRDCSDYGVMAREMSRHGTRGRAFQATARLDLM
jgi:hypothetical protein